MSNSNKNEKIVCISGYFDPLHVGHIEYMKKAKSLGDKLVVIVNNDYQASLKKGKSFMPCLERLAVVQSIRYVDKTVLSVDRDRTVCKTLEELDPLPNIFCNGGDQTNTSIPEKPICDRLGIKLVDGLGQKIQSSSWLIESGKDIKKV